MSTAIAALLDAVDALTHAEACYSRFAGHRECNCAAGELHPLAAAVREEMGREPTDAEIAELADVYADAARETSGRIGVSWRGLRAVERRVREGK